MRRNQPNRAVFAEPTHVRGSVRRSARGMAPLDSAAYLAALPPWLLSLRDGRCTYEQTNTVHIGHGYRLVLAQAVFRHVTRCQG